MHRRSWGIEGWNSQQLSSETQQRDRQLQSQRKTGRKSRRKSSPPLLLASTLLWPAVRPQWPWLKGSQGWSSGPGLGWRRKQIPCHGRWDWRATRSYFIGGLLRRPGREGMIVFLFHSPWLTHPASHKGGKYIPKHWELCRRERETGKKIEPKTCTAHRDEWRVQSWLLGKGVLDLTGWRLCNLVQDVQRRIFYVHHACCWLLEKNVQ